MCVSVSLLVFIILINQKRVSVPTWDITLYFPREGSWPYLSVPHFNLYYYCIQINTMSYMAFVQDREFDITTAKY